MTTPEDGETHNPAVHLGVDITEFLAALDAGADAYEAFIDKIVRGAARVSTVMGSADVTASERVVAAYKAEADAAVRAAAIVEEMENRKARARARTAAAIDRPARTRRPRTGSSEEAEATAEARAAEREQRRAETEAYRMEAARKRTGEATAPTRTRAQDEADAYRMEGARRKTEAAKNPPAPVVDHTAELAAERSAQAERVRLKTEADAKIRAIDKATAQQIRDDLANEMAAEQRAAHSRATMAAGAAEQRRINEARMESYRSAGHTIELATAGVTAGLYESVKAALAWQSGFTGVQRTVEGTAEDLTHLNKQLREIATVTPATPKEILETAQAAGQLGVHAPDVALFTRTVLALGTSTNITTEAASAGLGKFINIMGTAPSKVGQLGSTLAALGRTGASTESEILAMSLRVAAIGKVAGFTEADVLGLSTAMSGLGIRAELGGSAVTRTVVRMENAVEGGGKKLDAFAKVAGQSSAEFAAAFKESPAKALQSVVAGLAATTKAGGATFQQMQSIGAVGVRDQIVLSDLADGIGFLNKQMEIAQQAWKRPLDLLEISEQRYATTASKIQIARNQINGLGVDIGNALLPAVASAAQGLGGLAQAATIIPGPLQGMAASIGLSAVAAGLLGGAFLLMLPRIAKMKESLASAGLTVSDFAKRFIAVTVLIAATEWATKGIEAWTDEIERASGKRADILQLRRSLLDLGETGKASGEVARLWGTNLEGLKTQAKDFTEASSLDHWANRTINNLSVTGKAFRDLHHLIGKGAGLLNAIPIVGPALAFGTQEAGKTEPLNNAEKSFKDQDKAFADLVKAGVPVQELMKSVQILFDNSGLSMQQFVKAHPEMVDALKEIAVSEKEAAVSAEKHGDATESMAMKISHGAIDLKAFDDAVKDLDVETYKLDKANAQAADGYLKMDKAASSAAESIKSVRDAVKAAFDADFAPGEAFDKFAASWHKLTEDPDKKEDGRSGDRAEGGEDPAKAHRSSPKDARKSAVRAIHDHVLEGDSDLAISNRAGVTAAVKDFLDYFVTTQVKPGESDADVQAALAPQLGGLQQGLLQHGYQPGPFLNSVIGTAANSVLGAGQTAADAQNKAAADKQVGFDETSKAAVESIKAFAHTYDLRFKATGGLPNDTALSGEIDRQIGVVTQQLQAHGANPDQVNAATAPLQELKADIPALKETGKTTVERLAETNSLLGQILAAVTPKSANTREGALATGSKTADYYDTQAGKDSFKKETPENQKIIQNAYNLNRYGTAGPPKGTPGIADSPVVNTVPASAPAPPSSRPPGEEGNVNYVDNSRGEPAAGTKQSTAPAAPQGSTSSPGSADATAPAGLYWRLDPDGVWRLYGPAPDAAVGGVTSHAAGGFISGPGGPREDRIPAMLSNGEEVMNAAAVAKYRPLFDAMNAGMAPHVADAARMAHMPSRYADGGYVSAMPGYADGGPVSGAILAGGPWQNYHAAPGHARGGDGGSLDVQQLAAAVEGAAERGVSKGLAKANFTFHGSVDGQRLMTWQGRKADLQSRSTFR